MNKIIIAIDGFCACGKSTLAKNLAEQLGYIYIDSGAMYRAITVYALENNLVNASDNTVNEAKLIAALPQVALTFELVKQDNTMCNQIILNQKPLTSELRTMMVNYYVSKLSALEPVRKHILMSQRALGAQKGIVMDGRDIGTVVFPQAELKLFLTADINVRAQRRFNDLLMQGEAVSLLEVKNNLEQRDLLDQTRKESPLKQAPDALLLDNSSITKQQQLHWALQQAKLAAGA